ncbi:multiple sugar transport system substrate-binding protein/putative aldouronate transport system substrate-binding protein [Microbacterium ginsengiterrae]|uniref:Multiple sugar transport system substrate-binding protein/putative aldouronate transport system substrate-binding protein n=1 Tax=Microbacterium ginsengiterrae TaxID=546115 RepID=A0A7W9FBK7_9MICO|nr:ABC transporter substrate-binding protein [Microbacterium ginsengiterrae]MBB5743411.1 multiple sugar transport system substrate-binding protein/putative aldouronate transport system substrate-binding protein [Microbacterium ginsengiterrae]
MKLKRKAAAGIAALLAIGLLTSCTGGNSDKAVEQVDSFPSQWDEEITIDVFDGLANYMGVQEGWFGKIVKDKFNMKLNVIAPNVAGGGDTLYNTRVSAGDLGDLIIVNKGEQLDELIQGGLVADATPYLPAMEHVDRFDMALEKLNENVDGVYAFPTSVSSIPPTEPSEGIDPTFGPFLRWDLYAELGYPEIGTLEDLLPILQDMQELEPTAPNGQKVYALSLFKDWDGNFMNNAKQPITYYGYDEVQFALAMADGSDYQGILDDDGMYERVLRFFNKANEMGLVDPESTTQNYDTLWSKMQNGQVLFTWWPWLGQSAYNTDENMAAGKGFMIAPMQDQKIFSYGAEAYGGKPILAIGKNADDPERVAAFIDWLYSAEGSLTNSSQTMGAAGPQGLTWDMNDAGEPELTDFGKEVFLGGDAAVPAEWGGGNYLDGVSALNVSVVLPIDIDPDTGYPYNYKLWDSYQEFTANLLTEDWAAHMGGAATTMDYLVENDQVLVAPGASFTVPTDSSEIETLRNQVKAVIVQSSWQAVFAENEAQFDKIWTDLQETASGLGYDKVLEVDLATAKEQDKQRKAVVEEFAE